MGDALLCQRLSTLGLRRAQPDPPCFALRLAPADSRRQRARVLQPRRTEGSSHCEPAALCSGPARRVRIQPTACRFRSARTGSSSRSPIEVPFAYADRCPHRGAPMLRRGADRDRARGRRRPIGFRPRSAHMSAARGTSGTTTSRPAVRRRSAPSASHVSDPGARATRSSSASTATRRLSERKHVTRPSSGRDPELRPQRGSAPVSSEPARLPFAREEYIDAGGRLQRHDDRGGDRGVRDHVSGHDVLADRTTRRAGTGPERARRCRRAIASSCRGQRCLHS